MTIERDTIITHEHVPDQIVIEDTYKYSTYITIGLTNGGDFYVKLDFIDLDLNTISEVANLYKLKKALKFHSNLIEREGYKITHIVVTGMQTHSNYDMTWECLSDDPGFSLII